MNWVYKATGDEWLNGLSHEAVSETKIKFNPRDIISYVELRNTLGKVKMKINEYLITVFGQLVIIENNYNNKEIGNKSEEDNQIVVFLGKFPIDYQEVLTNIQNIKQALDNEAKIQELKDPIDKYQIKLNRDHKSINCDIWLSLVVLNGKCYK